MEEKRQFSNVELATLLNRVDPKGKFGPELHSALVRLTVSVAIEAVALRENGGRLEVLFRQRAMNEPSYPGEWHCPGSFVRNGEQVRDVLTRLSRSESLGLVSEFHLVDNMFWQEERGWICSAIYLVHLMDPFATTGAVHWFPVDELPTPTVIHHREWIVPATVKFFHEKYR